MTEAIDRVAAALSDRYRIERELGAGGMATVYLAHDLRHDRDVAIKVLRPNSPPRSAASASLRKMQITARLDHPHILTADRLRRSGRHSLLRHAVRARRVPACQADAERQLGVDDALDIAQQVARALDYAHAKA